MNERVLVTGGAGFLGINLVRFLLNKGYQVVSLDKEPFDYPERDNVIEYQGDIRDPALVSQAMSDVDIVVHCAAALPLNSDHEIYTTDVEGTRKVLKYAHISGVKKFVHISSTAVYGIPDHHPLHENDPLIGVGAYGKAKIDAERVCEEYHSKMPITILRPKSFIGPERLGVFALLYDWAYSGCHFPIPGHGNNRYQYLDVEDLCTAIYQSIIIQDDAVNDIFNIGAADFGTFRDDFQSVLDHAGYNKQIISFPVSPAIWTLRILDKFGLSPLYPWVYETAVKDSFVDISKAQEILKWEPKHSNKAALIRNFEWYVDNLTEFDGKSGVTHRVPWKQGVLAFAKCFFKL